MVKKAIIHDIVVELYEKINENKVDEPFKIYPQQFKNDRRAFAEALEEIVEEEIIVNFKVLSFNETVLVLNIKEASLSEYGIELAMKNRPFVRIHQYFENSNHNCSDA